MNCFISASVTPSSTPAAAGGLLLVAAVVLRVVVELRLVVVALGLDAVAAGDVPAAANFVNIRLDWCMNKIHDMMEICELDTMV